MSISGLDIKTDINMFLILLFTSGTLLLQASPAASPYSDPHCEAGRDTIVHLFEWKWTDIKAECERFLGPYGYCGVQISPPNENAIVTNPNRPWYERYQPASYKLITRSGNEQEFIDMVSSCNKVGVRIYVDAVINHTTGGYSGIGTAGSYFNGANCDFPGVPYGSQVCNGPDMCHSSDGSIHNYGNVIEVRNCRLFTLADLRLSKDYVRGKLADYLNRLIDIGVAGFRVDAAKHMWPGDLDIIFRRIKDLRNDIYGSGKSPFIFQEVIDMGGEPITMSEYFATGRVTNFIYGVKLSAIFLQNFDQAKWLDSWGEAWGMPNTNDVVVFLSNHDNQRGHGAGGELITFDHFKQLKIATAFMLAHPYGFPRIMSSFYWNKQNDWEGPPHNHDMSIKDVLVNQDMTCGNGWVCEHRWRQIYNMVAFRNVVAGTPFTNFRSYGDQQISFSRGNKGFVALVGDSSTLSQTINTGLPVGDYCDVISGNYINGSCSGKTVRVRENGETDLIIKGYSDDPVIAIHIGAKIGNPKKVTT